MQFLCQCHFLVYQCMHHLGNATQEYLLVSKNWASLFHFTIVTQYCQSQLSNIMHALFSYPCWHWRAPNYSKIFSHAGLIIVRKNQGTIQQHGMRCFHIYLSRLALAVGNTKTFSQRFNHWSRFRFINIFLNLSTQF